MRKSRRNKICKEKRAKHRSTRPHWGEFFDWCLEGWMKAHVLAGEIIQKRKAKDND